ncbi:MAG: septal ring lytic transglycosylase RlpA family protein, partial [Candidatus Pacearchaeota archaeon]|nr:septal ring lytic transglycosylase RlpA family protein [Candidatus Pacearchaeota archaeon]
MKLPLNAEFNNKKSVYSHNKYTKKGDKVVNRKWAIHFFNVFSLKKWVQLLFIVIMVCFSLSGTLGLYGEQTWHGNAAMIRRGEFSTAGFFAASNSFPLNTKILVKNLNSGYTTEVIVIQRLSDFYSVFL